MYKTNESQLTADFAHNNRPVFFPKTIDEVMFIQRELASFGIRWVDGKGVGSYAQECLGKGMVVENGMLYHTPDESKDGVICRSDQFSAEYLPPDRAFLLEQFNKMAERIDALSSRVEGLERQNAELQAALFPPFEKSKPSLRRPS